MTKQEPMPSKATPTLLQIDRDTVKYIGGIINDMHANYWFIYEDPKQDQVFKEIMNEIEGLM